VEREVVHTKPISKTEEVTVYRNLDNGDSHVEYGPRIFDENGKVVRASNDNEIIVMEHKAGEIIEEGKHKGKKTKGDFSAMEGEPEVVNWDGDIDWTGENVVNNVDELMTDTTKLEEFATGKKVSAVKKVKAAEKAKKLQKLQEDTLEQIDYIEKKQNMSIDDYVKEGAEKGDLSRGADVEGIGYNLPDKTKK